MEPTKEFDRVKLYQGDNIEVMKQLPDQIVNCCVTSPPYYAQRSYSICTCALKSKTPDENCTICGGTGTVIGMETEIGNEQTPEEYIQNLVNVFREVHRLLKDDGTLWVNIGDSYYNYRPGKGQSQTTQSLDSDNGSTMEICNRRGNKLAGLKEKDLIGIPWMLAFALRNDGWYLRQEIIWSKNSCLPESVVDRCTKSHEHIFLLAKSKNYYFDYESIMTPAKDIWKPKDRTKYKYQNDGTGLQPHSGFHKVYEKARKRSVWHVTHKPYHGDHYATYCPELIEPCVLAGCPVDGTVLDPFSGTATTGEVAIKQNKNYMGIELNKNYIEQSITRLNTAEGDLSLDARFYNLFGGTE